MVELDKIWDIQAQVLSISEICHGVFRGTFRAPEIARAAIPFQFVNVKVREGTEPLLRRPFSLSGIQPEEGLIQLTWASRGQGTSEMSRFRPGDVVSMLGPLGRGFSLSRDGLILLAGGTGLAPMYPLALAERKKGLEVTLLYGARSRDTLWDLEPFRAIGCKVLLATEDGSFGTKGTVVDLWTEFRSQRNLSASRHLVVLACGPKPMLSKVKSCFLESSRGSNEKLYLSLEEHMACGLGLCRGCAVRSSHEHEAYLHVCMDGPVFLATDVQL